MRVICLVPSLTETLLLAGVEVVGRTRFCIHPAELVRDIPAVGGTKGVNWKKCADLQPDLVLFDREENLKQMAEECPYPWFATHITSIATAASEFARLGEALAADEISEQAAQWQLIANTPDLQRVDWQQVPGQLHTLANQGEYQRLEYIIWRDPWMAVGRQTFIGSVLAKLGFGGYHNGHSTPYPTLDDAQMADPQTFYLFSSEPYRFVRYHQQLLEQGFHGAIVDGELYSWFGTRSLRGLQALLR